MAKQKKPGKASLVAWSRFGASVSLSRLAVNPVVWFLVATACMMVVSQKYWDTHGQNLLRLQRFQLSSEKVQVNSSVLWPNLLAVDELGRRVSLSERSLLEPNLLADIAAGLESIPEVDSVHQIRKSASGLDVELRYRSPIALVNIEGSAGNKYRMAIDREGWMLPKDVLERTEPVGITIFVMKPSLEGAIEFSPWPDQRIIDAARVAEQIQELAKEQGLCWIVTGRSSFATDSPFEIWTKNRGKVIWSEAPEKESPESNAQKIQWISDWVAKNGTLDQLAGWKKLDLRFEGARLIDDNGKIADSIEPSILY